MYLYYSDGEFSHFGILIEGSSEFYFMVITR
jgi:hypothetical protein